MHLQENNYKPTKTNKISVKCDAKENSKQN